MISITRTHEISCGHRVYGHESKCAHLHGHNYRFEITVECAAGLDALGRVIDFGVVKSNLCEWLETNWDHKLLLFVDDPLATDLAAMGLLLVTLPVNPTAENLARLFGRIANELLADIGTVTCTRVVVWETAKCSATWVR